jgi:phage gp29-like protein
VGLNVNATKPGETDLSPAQRQKLASQLRNLGRDAALVLPRGLDLKLIESAANNFQTYEAQINVANTGITICLLGQNLTTEVSGGSYAAAQVHSQVADYL